MRILLLLWCCLLALAPAPVLAQRGVTLTVSVTDGQGSPLEGVQVRATGPVSRNGTTDAKGTIRFQRTRAGDYRVRAEHEGFITLERMVTIVKASRSVEMALLPAPEPEPEPAAEPEPAPAPTAAAPPGKPASVTVVDFIERNFIPTDSDVKRDELGCTASATTTLVQVRAPLSERALEDADEVLYVVAGEGTLRLGNRDVPLEGSSLAVIPRGTVRGITRKGRNPLILLSIVSGQPCTM